MALHSVTDFIMIFFLENILDLYSLLWQFPEMVLENYFCIKKSFRKIKKVN